MEIEKKETANPCGFCGKELEVYPDEGGYRAKCSNCGIHTIVCKSQYAALNAYLSVTHAYSFTLVEASKIDNKIDNKEKTRRGEVIAKIREKLDLLRYFKGPLHEFDEISTLLEELK